MRPISQSLQDHELIILRVIGEWWDLDLTGKDEEECLRELAATLPQIDLAQELKLLPEEDADALQALVAVGGQIPVSQFSRQFGEIRAMGPAALAREEPWFAPISPAEDLWYRGLIFKGFDDTPEGLVEFIYLPDEYMEQFPAARPAMAKRGRAGKGSAAETAAAVSAPAVTPAGPRQAQPAYPTQPPPTSPPVEPPSPVQDLTTLISLAQTGSFDLNGEEPIPYLLDPHPQRKSLLRVLAEEMGLIRRLPEGVRPTRRAVPWLRASPAEALRQLQTAWGVSDWNELHNLPSLICEGSGWYNDPIAARQALVGALIADESWYAYDDLLAYVKENDPDFQRPNGNYNTWYIRDAKTDGYLNGFESWSEVEGRLLRYLLAGPMTWLGLARSAAASFCLTPAGVRWLEGVRVGGMGSPQPGGEGSMEVEGRGEGPAESLRVTEDGRLVIPLGVDRYRRFQAGRFAALLPATSQQEYTYRITSRTLKKARDEGILPERVLQFLEEAAGGRLPASVRRAIERWSEFGTEARLEEVVILRVSKEEILQTLRQHPKTRPYLRESLGDLSAAVAAEEWPALLSAAAQLGLFLEPLDGQPNE